MIKLFYFFSLCLLLFFFSCRNSQTKNAQITNSPLIGSWIWNNKTTYTATGIITQDDYGLSIGAGIKGIVISKIIFTPDKSIQNIVESNGKSLSDEKGKWEIKQDTLLMNWGKGKLQISTYKIIDDSLFIHLINSNSTIKYIKKI